MQSNGAEGSNLQEKNSGRCCTYLLKNKLFTFNTNQYMILIGLFHQNAG